MKTPVVLLCFNRPRHTAQVLARIRALAPSHLFVVADGPRATHPADAALCEETRQLIGEGLDWDCELFTNFSPTNQGCARRVSSGLTWVFDQVEQAIILEDDCLVDPSFGPFAERLLERYRFQEDIMAISAARLFPFSEGEPDLPYSISAYFHCWGWATWRRAWKHFHYSLKQWRQQCSPAELQQFLGTAEQRRYWTYMFDRTHRLENSWAFRYQFACWEQRGFTVLPRVNMTENIGFDETAVHTRPDCDNPCDQAHSLFLPGQLPESVPRNVLYERKVAQSQKLLPLLTRAQRKLAQFISGPVR